MKYGNMTFGRMEAIINRLGGEEGVNRFLRGELEVTAIRRCWREENGVMYLSVTSDGTTGSEWIKRLEKKGFRVSDYAKHLLNSPDFKPKNGVTYNLAILKGELYSDDQRITKNIRADAANRKLTAPNAEVACLLREALSDKEMESMGLWYIATMHDPIKDPDGNPNLLGMDRLDGGRWLYAGYGRPDDKWCRSFGFAFVVSQVGPSD